METIKNYLETMFAQLPQTPQVLEMKEDLLLNMEEKYHELKNHGKSENEAIGIVISEFGNIDELVSELGISKISASTSKEEALPIITLDSTLSYLDIKKKTGHLIGIGVALILIGVSILIGLTTLAETQSLKNISEEFASTLGVILLILLIVPAVGLFIYSGTLLEKFNYLQKPFQLDTSVQELLRKNYEEFLPGFNRSVIIGVCLCIFSVIPIIASSLLEFGKNTASYVDHIASFGVIVCLLIIAIAVYLFVTHGTVKEGYQCLLELEDFSPDKKDSKASKVVGAVASIVWPLATCTFLLLGFLKNRWDIAWIIFPITGILFGMFSAVCNIIWGETKK